MAGKGTLTKPPSRAQQVARHKAEAENRAKGKGGARFMGLNKDQNAAINQQQGQDLGIGATKGGLLSGINDSYSQPFNWDSVTQAPVTGDFGDWRDTQIQQGNQAFDSRMNPIFEQQKQDFDQQMANRGIPMGSDLYNKQYQQLQQSQNDARQQGYFQNSQNAGQNAQQFFDIGTQAHQGSYNDQLARRNMPAQDYATLSGLQSPMMMQNLGYSQTLGAQNNQAKQQLWVNKNSPHGGGGGGGGGGEPPIWQQYGFSSPQEYDAYSDARGINQYNATHPQQQQPNPYVSLGGSILGSVTQGIMNGWAGNGFKNPF